jgi:hypothetical protein
MGFDLFRHDNRTAARFDDDVYFRATARAWPLIVQSLAAVGILDQAIPTPPPEAPDRLATRSPVPGMVPEWKFLDNAGWHVVPEECIAIADALEAVVRATRSALADLDDDERARLDFVERFARFSRTAAPHGGYAVR